MPAKSAAQQKAAGAALSAKRGKTSPSKLKGASRRHVQIDERETARRVCLDQAQGQAGACCEAAHEEVGVALNGAEIASAQEYGAEDHGA